MEVIVVGNGILGLTAAYRLVKRDPALRIRLIGPADQRGCASRAAAAMFNSFCEVDSGTFANDHERRKILFNMAATSHWPSFLKQLAEESGQAIHHGFGTYLVNNHFSDALEDEHFDAVVAALKQFEEPYEWVVPAQIPHYKPEARSRAGRAIYIPGEGWVNPLQLMAALRTCLERSGRVTFVDGYCRSLARGKKGVEAALLENGERLAGDVFLLCPGANFTQIVSRSDLGIQMPKVFYGIGCSLLLKTGDNTLHHCIRTPNRGLACGIYSSPQDSEHTLVGASNFTSHVAEDHGRLTSVYTILKAAMEQIHSDFYRAQLVRVNVGWRPTSEDTFPLLGKTSLANLWVATGTKRDGLHCSPLISELLAESMLTGKSSADIELFDPERSPIRHLTRDEAIRTAVRHTISAAFQHDFVPAKDRMIENIERYHTHDLNELHDRVGAREWGIPPELISLFRYGHIR